MTGVSPVAVFAVYFLVGIAVPPIVFYLSKTPFNWADVVAASAAGAVLQWIPTVGGVIALVAMGAVLYWRSKPSVPVLIAAVGGSRLIMIGVFLAIRPPG